MEILQRGANAVELVKDIATLIDEARKKPMDREQLLRALVDYKDDPTAVGVVAGIVKAMNLDGANIQRFVADNEAHLPILLGTVADIGEDALAWAIDGAHAANANAVAIDVGMSAAASIGADDDGDLFDDGTITYDPERERFMTLEVSGKVSAGMSVPSFPVSTVQGGVAFGANASLLVGNYFRHQADEEALSALVRDVREWTLPYDVSRLRDGQYVRLHGTGSVSVSGEVSWGKTIVATGNVAASAIDLIASPITAEVKLAASVGFDAAMEGVFNIIISSVGESGTVRVRLVDSRTTKRGTTLAADAGITISGIDRVANAVLAQVTTPLNPLVKLLENDLQKYGDLHKLFKDDVSAGVTNLLNDPKIVGQLQDWLIAIGSNLDLREKLKEILVNAIDAHAGATVDQLQTTLQPVIVHVKNLIELYQRSLARVRKAVSAAAEVKIGIELARKQQSSEERKTALDISIDPVKHQSAYRQMVHGDFSAALRLARDPASGVVVNEAEWTGHGGISLESSFSISAFGINVGVGSLLKQEWDWEISAAGDLSLGVTAHLTTWSRSWHALRSLTVLADTRLLAVLSSAGELLDPKINDSVNVEASRDWRPSRTMLCEWERLMLQMNVLDEPTRMSDEIATPTIAKYPYGELVTSAILNLTEDQLRRIAEQTTADAISHFSEQLLRFYLARHPSPYNHRDEEDRPFLLWPSVREWAAGVAGTTTFFDNLKFTSGEMRVQVSKERLPLVASNSRLITGFGHVHERLRRLHQTPLTGLPLEQALNSLCLEQRRLMNDIKGILAATMLNREDLGFTFFVTLWQLGGGAEALNPYVVVLRKGDERRFVYA